MLQIHFNVSLNISLNFSINKKDFSFNAWSSKKDQDHFTLPKKRKKSPSQKARNLKRWLEYREKTKKTLENSTTPESSAQSFDVTLASKLYLWEEEKKWKPLIYLHFFVVKPLKVKSNNIGSQYIVLRMKSCVKVKSGTNEHGPGAFLPVCASQSASCFTFVLLLLMLAEYPRIWTLPLPFSTVKKVFF